MDKMKKLLMVDSRTFNRLTTPKDKVLTSIEGEMTSILNDESIPEDVKAKTVCVCAVPISENRIPSVGRNYYKENSEPTECRIG